MHEIYATINWQDGALRLYSPGRVDKDEFNALRAQGFGVKRGETTFKAAYTPYREKFLRDTYQIGELEDDDTDPVAEAEDRSERYGKRSDKQASEAASRFKASDDLVSGIPMGQPILVGHHSEKHHRRTLERSHNHMRAGLDASEKSSYWARRAASAIRQAEVKMTAPATYRRIERLEADQRKMQRHRDEFEANAVKAGREQTTHWPTMRWLWFYENRLAFERALLQHLQEAQVAVGGSALLHAQREDFVKDGYFRTRGLWYRVARVNQKTVSYTTFACDLKCAFTDVRPGDTMTPAQFAAAVAASRVKPAQGGAFKLLHEQAAPEAGDREPLENAGILSLKEDAMHTLYTIGYSGVKAEDLHRWAQSHGALVVDTRMNAYSPRPEWAKAQLAKRFGDRYRHVQALGNVNYKSGGEIALKDPAEGFRIVLESLVSQPVVLLCGCKDVETCHRKFIADALEASTGTPAVHLAPQDLAAPADVEVSVTTPDTPDGDVLQRGLFSSRDDLIVNPPARQMKLF